MDAMELNGLVSGSNPTLGDPPPYDSTFDPSKRAWRMRNGSVANPNRPNRQCQALDPVVHFLRFVGLFPDFLPGKVSGRPVLYGLKVYSLVLVAINLAAFSLTVGLTEFFYNEIGMWHAYTICAILTGIKPLIVAANISFFNLGINIHKKIFDQLAVLSSDYKVKPNFFAIKTYFFSIMIMTVVISLAMKIVEYIKTGWSPTLLGCILFADWKNDITLVLVPLINIWLIAPLVLFCLMQGLVRFFCRQLCREIEHAVEDSMGYHFQKFIRITTFQSLLSDLYGGWILFSLIWAIFSICLTIYFGTQMGSTMTVPTKLIYGLNASEIGQLQLSLWFNIGWSVMQICIAAVYLTSICFVGRMTNETSRVIVKQVLHSVGPQSSEQDRSQVTFFMFKMSMQHAWGVTVWRAFPIERGVFFTIASLITSYVVVLLKFRGDASSNEKSAQNNDTVS